MLLREAELLAEFAFSTVVMTLRFDFTPMRNTIERLLFTSNLNTISLFPNGNFRRIGRS